MVTIKKKEREREVHWFNRINCFQRYHSSLGRMLWYINTFLSILPQADYIVWLYFWESTKKDWQILCCPLPIMLGTIVKNYPWGSLTLEPSALSQPSPARRPHTSPSLIPISDNLNCQKSSSSKIFTRRYFFTLSVQVFVHQKQWISCNGFSCFEFSVPQGKKKGGDALSHPNMDSVPVFSL